MRADVDNAVSAQPDPVGLDRLRALLDMAGLSRGDRGLDDVLEGIASTIATGLGWRTVAINLYRPAWDDFQVTSIHGGEDVRAALLGVTSEWEQWRPLLLERFRRGEAFLVDHADFDWSGEELPTFVPELEKLDAPDAWDAEDALIVPLAHSDGHLLGILSVDEPISGRRPGDDEIDLICAVAAQAARAIEHVQRQAELRRYRAALEHLHDVSTRLSVAATPEAALEAVAQGISRALGFYRVGVFLDDGQGFASAALAGWAPGEAPLRSKLSRTDFGRLADKRFEIEGCYLLPLAEAMERCSAESDYESRMNGRGPWAWNRHWLVAPLSTEDGETIGFIWADDPEDRLLPSQEKLRVLRMFANHAATALELARAFAAEHEANETLRASITASPLAIFSVDTEGIVRSWNDAAEQMYGWSADEIVGKPYPSVGPEQRLEFQHLLQTVLGGASFSGLEVARTGRDGKRFDVSASAAPLRKADGTIERAIVLHADITDRKSASYELERRKQELETLHNTTLDVVEHLDSEHAIESIISRACELLDTEHGFLYLVEDGTNELAVALGTGAFAEYVGVRLARGIGLAGRVWETGRALAVDCYRDWGERAEPFEGLEFRAVIGVPLRSKDRFIGVLGVGHRDGKMFEADEIALLEQFGRLASLALENARLFEEVRQSQELYGRVLDTSTDMAALFELDGTITFASRAAETVIGWTPDELVGRSFVDLIHPDDLATANAVILDAVAQDASRPSTARLRHKDGSWVTVEGKPAVIRNERGEPELILGIARDVSDRVEAENRRRELEAQLRQSQKMEAVGSLAGGIAHDFNNLLTAIAGYGDLALTAVPEGHDELKSDIGEMLAAGERARQLIRQLLAFSRKQVLQPTVLDLNETVSSMQSILRRLIGENVELVTMLDSQLGHTNADPGQLEQVLLNLCINARDAMPDGGRLEIETLITELDSAFVTTHVGSRVGPCVALRVSDTGHGMDAETQSRVFEPFFTTKEERGTGLGLSTVYGIVKQSDGYIWCDSEPGVGTTFTVYLPRFEAEAPAAESESAPAVEAGGSEVVLLAEDEQVVRRLVKEMLERLGYSVLVASNGAEALERLEEHADRVDLLLTDVVMPGMSGRELAGVVRRRCPKARVLFMSGYAEDAVESQGVLQPGAQLLEKPFTATNLGAKVRAVLDGAVG